MDTTPGGRTRMMTDFNVNWSNPFSLCYWQGHYLSSGTCRYCCIDINNRSTTPFIRMEVFEYVSWLNEPNKSFRGNQRFTATAKSCRGQECVIAFVRVYI